VRSPNTHGCRTMALMRLLLSPNLYFALISLILCVSGNNPHSRNLNIQQWIVEKSTNDCLGHNLEYETCSHNNIWNFSSNSKFGWNIISSNTSRTSANKCLQRKHFDSLDLVMQDCPSPHQHKTMFQNEKWILEPSPTRTTTTKGSHSSSSSSALVQKREYIIVWREWFRLRQLCVSRKVEQENEMDGSANSITLTANPNLCAVFHMVRDIQSSRSTRSSKSVGKSINMETHNYIYDYWFSNNVHKQDDDEYDEDDNELHDHSILSSIRQFSLSSLSAASTSSSIHLNSPQHKLPILSNHQKLSPSHQTPLAVKAVLSPSSSSTTSAPSSSSLSPSSFPSTSFSSMFGFATTTSTSATPVAKPTQSLNHQDVRTASGYDHKHTHTHPSLLVPSPSTSHP
jgi:hypothetical protein